MSARADRDAWSAVVALGYSDVATAHRLAGFRHAVERHDQPFDPTELVVAWVDGYSSWRQEDGARKCMDRMMAALVAAHVEIERLSGTPGDKP